MHRDRNQKESGNTLTNEAADAAVQLAVLMVVLDRHPAQLTLAELVREIAEDPADFAQCDAIESAARDVAGAGLLHRHGEFVIPTRAALFFDWLSGEGSRA